MNHGNKKTETQKPLDRQLCGQNSLVSVWKSTVLEFESKITIW